MVGVRGIISVLAGVLVLSAAAYADKASVPGKDVLCRQSVCAGTESGIQTGDSSGLLDDPDLVLLCLRAAHFELTTSENLRPAIGAKRLQLHRYGRRSPSLCLPDLVEPELRSSGHHSKKRRFGPTPGFFYNDGLLQTGYDVITHPYSFYPVPVCCFVQPVWTAEDRAPQYRLGTTVSLWRNFQFTLGTHGCRPPPNRS